MGGALNISFAPLGSPTMALVGPAGSIDLASDPLYTAYNHRT